MVVNQDTSIIVHVGSKRKIKENAFIRYHL